ncbi:MAG: hypothetical protein AB1349_04985 [Elusimicrobiota bacterium]
MRKLLGLLLVLGLTATAVYAASNPGTCKLTVTPTGTYSVSIGTENATRDFGSVALDDFDDVLIGTVTNDGTLGCDMCGAGSNADSDAPDVDWTIEANAADQGTDQYSLQVGTGTSLTGAGYPNNWTDIATETEINNATTITAGSSACMVAKIHLPNTSTSSDQFTITLSIWARAVD